MTRRVLAGLVFAALASCDTPPIEPKPFFVPVVTGTLERGMIVRVGARFENDTAVTPVTSLAVAPSSAGVIFGNGDILLKTAGAIQISGIAVDGSPLAIDTVVAAPPSVVFSGLAAGNRDVYRVAIDGGDLVRLTEHAADDVHPSQTGANVVFTTYRDGNAELYAMSSDGSNQRRLTTTTKNETQAVLSPDGRFLVYANDVTGVARVWIASVDFAAASPLSLAAQLSPPTFGSGATVEGSPSWSPASDKIVLMTTATPNGSAGLFIADAIANSTPVLVTGSGSVIEVEPAWSPDGFRIAYAAPIGNATEIFVRDIRTSVVTQLTTNTGSSGQPTWLSDGRLVFTTFAGPTSSIRWIDPAAPAMIHAIPTPGLTAEHPAPVRP